MLENSRDETFQTCFVVKTECLLVIAILFASKLKDLISAGASEVFKVQRLIVISWLAIRLQIITRYTCRFCPCMTVILPVVWVFNPT